MIEVIITILFLSNLQHSKLRYDNFILFTSTRVLTFIIRIKRPLTNIKCCNQFITVRNMFQKKCLNVCAEQTKKKLNTKQQQCTKYMLYIVRFCNSFSELLVLSQIFSLFVYLIVINPFSPCFHMNISAPCPNRAMNKNRQP